MAIIPGAVVTGVHRVKLPEALRKLERWFWIHFVRIDNGTDLCFWLARDAREFSESRPVFPSTNNLESFHYLIYTHDTQALALGRRPSQTLCRSECFPKYEKTADNTARFASAREHHVRRHLPSPLLNSRQRFLCKKLDNTTMCRILSIANRFAISPFASKSAPKLRWPTFLPLRPAPFNAVREAQCQSQGKLGWLSRCSQGRLSMRQSAIRLTPRSTSATSQTSFPARR